VIAGGRGEALFSALGGRVRYVGAIANEEVVSVYARARVLLSSSRWEGRPVAANEALAMGCTVVAPALLA
jgi:glycosyltransferase involved in cell wall biosynthesis